MKWKIVASRWPHTAKLFNNGVFVVVLFTFLAWSLRVAFVSFDALSDLTIAGVLNEVLRAVIFVGPVLIYLKYVERARVLAFLRLNKPRQNTSLVLPAVGALFIVWYLLMDSVVGD